MFGMSGPRTPQNKKPEVELSSKKLERPFGLYEKFISGGNRLIALCSLALATSFAPGISKAENTDSLKDLIIKAQNEDGGAAKIKEQKIDQIQKVDTAEAETNDAIKTLDPVSLESLQEFYTDSIDVVNSEPFILEVDKLNQDLQKIISISQTAELKSLDSETNQKGLNLDLPSKEFREMVSSGALDYARINESMKNMSSLINKSIEEKRFIKEFNQKNNANQAAFDRRDMHSLYTKKQILKEYNGILSPEENGPVKIIKTTIKSDGPYSLGASRDYQMRYRFGNKEVNAAMETMKPFVNEATKALARSLGCNVEEVNTNVEVNSSFHFNNNMKYNYNNSHPTLTANFCYNKNYEGVKYNYFFKTFNNSNGYGAENLNKPTGSAVKWEAVGEKGGKYGGTESNTIQSAMISNRITSAIGIDVSLPIGKSGIELAVLAGLQQGYVHDGKKMTPAAAFILREPKSGLEITFFPGFKMNDVKHPPVAVFKMINKKF